MRHLLDLSGRWQEPPFCFEHHTDGGGNPVPPEPCAECGVLTVAHMRTAEGGGWIRLCKECMEPYMLEWIVPQ